MDKESLKDSLISEVSITKIIIEWIVSLLEILI